MARGVDKTGDHNNKPNIPNEEISIKKKKFDRVLALKTLEMADKFDHKVDYVFCQEFPLMGSEPITFRNYRHHLAHKGPDWLAKAIRRLCDIKRTVDDSHAGDIQLMKKYFSTWMVRSAGYQKTKRLFEGV